MFWRVLHDTLKWLWPAAFAGAMALGTVAIAAAEVWPTAKVEVGRVFTAGIAVLTNPWSWLILLAVFVAWLFAFIWSGLKVTAPLEACNSDMPLYLACRWIARESTWASRLHPSRDNDWVSLVDAQLMTKVHQGQIELFGVPRGRGGAHYPIPKDFTDVAQWHNYNLVNGEDPPTHMWASSQAKISGPLVYYDVKLDSGQVRRLWPRRGAWARWKKMSPIERIGDYRPIFRRQDVAYQERHGFFDAPLEAHLREAIG